MTNMNKDEKRLMLFDMQEHPEKYTDEQIERLLADEEVKDFLRDLAMARMAGKKATPKKVDVDKAWKEFANGSYRNRMKIAASIVGIIFLSGVAFAAVQNGSLIQSIALEIWLNTVTLLTPTSSATSLYDLSCR